MLSLNIVGRFNSAGVENDMKILGTLLQEMGHSVTYTEAANKSLYYALHKKIAYDANIFIEQPEPLLYRAARKNFLKPNQEVIFKTEGLDALLVKTRYAEELFRKLGSKVHHIGFTSLDRYNGSTLKEPFVLHMTSRSTLKGTVEVIEAWRRYRDLPKLVVLLAPLFRHLMQELPHVVWIDRYLPEDELIELQNKATYHLCPSYAEGFGHTICEGLSVGSLVITTNGPPMNELVTEERGFLCSWTNEVPAGYGQGFYATPENIYEAVTKALQISNKKERMTEARAFFETLRPRLKASLGTFLAEEF